VVRLRDWGVSGALVTTRASAARLRANEGARASLTPARVLRIGRYERYGRALRRVERQAREADEVVVAVASTGKAIRRSRARFEEDAAATFFVTRSTIMRAWTDASS